MCSNWVNLVSQSSWQAVFGPRGVWAALALSWVPHYPSLSELPPWELQQGKEWRPLADPARQTASGSTEGVGAAFTSFLRAGRQEQSGEKELSKNILKQTHEWEGILSFLRECHTPPGKHGMLNASFVFLEKHWNSQLKVPKMCSRRLSVKLVKIHI